MADGWPWLAMAGHGWPWLAMTGHDWPWLAMAGQPGRPMADQFFNGFCNHCWPWPTVATHAPLAMAIVGEEQNGRLWTGLRVSSQLYFRLWLRERFRVWLHVQDANLITNLRCKSAY